MNILKTTMAMAFALSVCFVSCKPKDADVKTKVENKIKPEAPNVMVSVTDGVATLTGEVKDEATKAAVESMAKEAGAKSVVNNTMVTPAFTPPVIVADDPLMMSVKDATKDYPTVNAEVMDGVIMLTGSVSAEQNKQLMMTLNGLGAKRIDNKLDIK